MTEVGVVLTLAVVLGEVPEVGTSVELCAIVLRTAAVVLGVTELASSASTLGKAIVPRNNIGRIMSKIGERLGYVFWYNDQAE